MAFSEIVVGHEYPLETIAEINDFAARATVQYIHPALREKEIYTWKGCDYTAPTETLMSLVPKGFMGSFSHLMGRLDRFNTEADFPRRKRGDERVLVGNCGISYTIFGTAAFGGRADIPFSVGITHCVVIGKFDNRIKVSVTQQDLKVLTARMSGVKRDSRFPGDSGIRSRIVNFSPKNGRKNF